MRSLIYLVILNWNGKEDTLACLNSLKKLNYINYEVIVVDNGSTDGSEDVFRAYYPDLKVIQTGQNLGYAEGNNVGIRYALEKNAEYILLLNNDTIVDSDLLNELELAADNNPNVGVFGATLLYMDNPKIIWFAGAKWNPQTLTFDYPYQDQKIPENLYTKTDYACGAALFFRSEVAKSIGLLDARFFLVWEESDWCLRAKRVGYGCQQVPAAYVWHKVGVSFDGEDSPLREYFDFRNRLLWAEKNIPLNDFFRLIISSIFSLFPHFSIYSSEKTPFLKSLAWAVVDFKTNWFNPNLRAKRRGIMDYFFRQFGDCPDSIRMLNKTYKVTTHKNN
ncbi:glycosyltransferase family 2 protein [Methylicorpusculum sp.]|nr:glycosyltransferase family 2 protein [Methylicorpusculum sp.]MDO8845975.1 glycosyltransferase family 2 protein [Methylicorpusculum sp.]MDP3531246.1 glycosyltransferase family 2 protein [Methylicorpusculum sp.]